MTFKNFVCKGILVFAGLLLLGWIGKYIYMVDGEIDWFRFMLVYGVPVGIPHMFIIIPWHWDLSGILGMAALCVIVGGDIWLCDCSMAWNPGGMVYGGISNQQDCGDT